MRLPGSDERVMVADPLAFGQAIRAAITACELRRVRPVLGHGDQQPQGRSGIPRLTMVVEGRRRIRWPAPFGITTQYLNPGGCIFVHPSGWTQPKADQPHRYLSIDCYPDFTRFRLDAPNDPRADDGAFHSGGPLPSPARGLLQCLIALAEQGAARRMLPVMRCFLDEVVRECRPWPADQPGLGEWQRAVAWVIDHIGLELHRDAIAAQVGVHPNHLSRLCKRFTGGSLSDFLTEQRMAAARDLLRRGQAAVAEVARLAGYHDETHFRKRFKQVHGVTPGQYRGQG